MMERMDSAGQSLHNRADALRQDLGTEYQAIVKVVSDFDGRLMIVKGWSVTLSLTSLGLGFYQGHYALFALAAGSALAFWFIDGDMKRHQMRYYARMRDIEVAAFNLNHLDLGGQIVSSPLIDWSWNRKGRTDLRSEPPARLTAPEVQSLLRKAPWMGHVLLPHALAVVLGLALFLGAVIEVDGLQSLVP